LIHIEREFKDINQMIHKHFTATHPSNASIESASTVVPTFDDSKLITKLTNTEAKLSNLSKHVKESNLFLIFSL
jgi:hypothetical protein